MIKSFNSVSSVGMKQTTGSSQTPGPPVPWPGAPVQAEG